jgi:hypothetical protein
VGAASVLEAAQQLQQDTIPIEQLTKWLHGSSAPMQSVVLVGGTRARFYLIRKAELVDCYRNSGRPLALLYHKNEQWYSIQCQMRRLA